jgi:hypothetical protein
MTFTFKFFPFKDFIFSIIPTIGTYGGFLDGIITFPNKWMAFGSGFAVSVILAIIFHAENKRNYRRSLAEILAMGYFMNFTGRLAKLLKGKADISFSFPDANLVAYPPGKVNVKVGIPGTLNALVKYCNMVEAQCDVVYIRESTKNDPYWVRAKKEDDGTITIYEFPRTLFALSRYLEKEFENQHKAEKNSKKIYKYFDEKLKQLKIQHSNEFPNDRIKFEYV